MSQNFPVINSGVVEAPPSNSGPNHPASPTHAAPSQASQDFPPSHSATNGAAPLHPSTHQLNSHAYETGAAGGPQQPFQPVSQGQAPPPPLPPRDQDAHAPLAEEQDPVHHNGRRHPGPHSTIVEQPHIAGLHRGDYASGAPHAAGTHPETSAAGTGTGAVGNGEYGEVAGTSATGVDGRTTGEKVREGAGGIKGVAAAVHGVGEALRGTFNREVDRAFHDKAGEIRNDRIAREGEAEIQNGRFASSTKEREGVVPGADHGERRHQL